jgi:hypothetical protein
MEDFARQQFDVMLQEAAGNLADRAIHRCGGPEAAIATLRDDPDAEGVWLTDFVAAVFDEQLLTTPAGAAFVLEALPTRTLPSDPGGPAAEVIQRLARAAFADVVRIQAGQVLQRRLAFA